MIEFYAVKLYNVNSFIKQKENVNIDIIIKISIPFFIVKRLLKGVREYENQSIRLFQ